MQSRKIACKEVEQARIICIKHWELEKDEKL
jgi:hypothetical protein